MSEIHIDYDVVAAQVLKLRSFMSAQIREAEAAYTSILSSLDLYDSATNASYIRIITNNRRKAESADRGIDKLLNFIKNSSEQMRLEDVRLSGVFRRLTREAQLPHSKTQQMH